MFQIKVKINLLGKIVLWALGTVSPLPVSIWMVWGTMPRLSYHLEMTVIGGEADSGIEFSVPGCSGPDSLLTGLFLRKSWVSSTEGMVSSCPISPLQSSRDRLTNAQKLQLPWTPPVGAECSPEPHFGGGDFEEAWETGIALHCYRRNNSQHTDNSNLHASLPIINNPLPYDQ